MHVHHTTCASKGSSGMMHLHPMHAAHALVHAQGTCAGRRARTVSLMQGPRGRMQVFDCGGGIALCAALSRRV